MKTEPVTQAQVDLLVRALGPIPAQVSHLGDVDIRRGRGILEGQDRCLWTRDGRRITIGLPRGGGIIVACGRDPDPEAPEPA